MFIINFIREYIIHRFNLTETITTYQRSIFTSQEVKNFAEESGFKIIHSTLYSAQDNEQAKATNKLLINNIKRFIGERPRVWHEVLPEVF